MHHITVMCYNLQHPGYFSGEALAWMRSSLRGAMVGGLSQAELRKIGKNKCGGEVKVRCRTTTATTPLRVPWSRTIMDVRAESPEVYVEDIRAWAKSILNDVEAFSRSS